MEDKQDPFRRSSRLTRTPPMPLETKVGAPAKRQANESHILDPTQHSCELCSELDTIDMVQCEQCNVWLHFTCAQVTEDIAEKDFVCQRCRVGTSTVSQTRVEVVSRTGSRASKTSSTARSEARRKQLALERIEEERKLKEVRDREYLDKKYKTLEEFSVDSSSDTEPDDEKSNINNVLKYTSQWVDNQRELVELSSTLRVSQPNVNEIVDATTQIHPHTSVMINHQNQVSTVSETSNTNQTLLTQQVRAPSHDQSYGMQRSDGLVQIDRANVENAPDQTKIDDQFTQVRNYERSSIPWGQTDSYNDNSHNKSVFDADRHQFTPNPWLENLCMPTSSSQDRNQIFTTTNGQPTNIATNLAMNTVFNQQLSSLDMGQRYTSDLSGFQPPNFVGTGYGTTVGRSSFNGQPLTCNVTTTPNVTLSQPIVVTSKIVRPATVRRIPQVAGSNDVFWSTQSNVRTLTTPLTGFHQPIGANSSIRKTAPQATQSFGLPVFSHATQSASNRFCGGFQPNTTIVPHVTQPIPQVTQSSRSYQTPSSQQLWLNPTTGTTQTSGGHQLNYPGQFSGNPVPHNTRSAANQYQTNTIPQVGSTSLVADTDRTLTQRQIAARQVVSRKLPVFHGEIEKFPAFIRAYESSTAMCGFDNGENLSRLAESVKGIAHDFVEHQLLYPDDVPQVIETLKMIFGNPEFVLDKLMSKIAKQASPQVEDLSSIVKFSMAVQNICGTIKSAELTEHLRNPTLMKALVDKLPPSQQLMWACHRENIPDANLETLGAWLYNLARLASSISGPPKLKKEKKPEKTDEYVNAQVESTPKTSSAKSKSQTTHKCPACNQSSCQRLKECRRFVSLDLKERWAIVKEKELCLRCFGKHRFKSCRSKDKCNVGACQRAHNPMLHDNNQHSPATAPNANVPKGEGVNVNCSHQSLGRKVDIFRIAPVVLHHGGKSIQTFAYLDDGSNITTMESELADELELEGSAQEKLCVKWSFGKIRKEELVSKRVSVQNSGVYPNAAKYDLHNVRTVEDLALPSQTISQEWLNSYKHFENLPITPYENGKPRMLIGLQYSKLMVSRRTIEGQWSEPIACKTILGWIVQGPDGDEHKKLNADMNFSMNICQCHRDDSELHMMVKEFFSWDSLGVKIPETILESKENQRARKILESTTRKVNGRYETGLLWRYDDVKFPETYPMALKRLECLERKMEKDPVLATNMCNYIQDFLEKRYVRKMTQDELQRQVSRVFYLPMFPVFNPKKPEKFRVVWDAAAMVKKISLNSMLLAGPDLLNPLPDVLRRFREKAIAITGDMKEMFHQVRVIDSDVHAQRFLWRDGNSKRKPEVLVVEVLTFGGKNSPSSAQYVKNTNALEYKDQFPRAVKAITDNHYQDDMLESFETVEEATRLTEEVKLIHRNGGFEMRNFKSNSNKVLEKLGEKLENHQKNLDISTEPVTERVLGMFWNTSTDTFTFSLKYTKLSEEVFKGIRRPTKREVLSAIMSIFDPLGLIAQYLVYGKILLQKIWRDGTDWDEQLSDSSYKHWLTWIAVLPEIEKIEIPRWYSPKLVATNQKRIQLHIFVDAGVEACAATVYYRIEDEEGVDCCLIGAKTKVAPNKPLSVPRLELQAAVLGLRLVDNVSKCHNIQVTERFFWSDSQTVLGWINSEARKFHQYVAFRIGEILENSSTTEWNWVETKHNVADDATKWVNKPDLSSSARWYKAPSFLYQPQDTWHKVNGKTKFSTDEEMRAVYLLAHIEIPNNDINNAKNFSNWRRLERAVAYALRFIDNSRLRKKDRRIGPFMREEYIRARNTLFRQVQREEFLDKILVIRNNESLPVGERKELHKSSVLRTCSPYLDEDGLLRIRRRIEAAQSVSFKTKRPIILPRHNYITKLLVYSYHQKFHHVNHQTTLNQITQTFYIPALRVVLKSVIENLCQRCKNDKAKPVVPEMAELPPARLSTFTRVFSYVGVDYFGPLKVKVRRSPEKRWGVIFTCLTTRAVYIDVAHSYDTSSCILCIRNFSNRNGPPVAYYSDNGSNFYGAERELREEFRKMNKTKIEETFTTEHTQWFFNPPTAAHMGGVWERPIRTIKSALKKLMSTRLPTDEMLKSYFIEIENIINSTPLTYVQLDNIDNEVLTPNHFLKGSSNGLKSPGRFDPKSLCRDDWKAVQVMTNQFWRQFVLEYMPTLTRRTKWFTQVKQLEVGDLVIDCDEDSNRNDWRKVIIEEVAIGKGNQVRRAKVRMIRGEKAKLSNLDVKDIKHQSLWRPTSKLAILDVKGNRLSSSPEAVNRKGNVVNTS